MMKLHEGRMIPKHHEILDHLFPQVVINAVDLILSEQRGQVGGELPGALQVPTKRLFHNYSVPASAIKKFMLNYKGQKVCSPFPNV